MPANESQVAHYADALVSLLQAHKCAGNVEQQLLDVGQFIREDRKLRRFLADPAVLNDGKRDALQKILGDHVVPVLMHFILILFESGDLELLDDIADALAKRLDGGEERVYGELVTACPLSPEKVAAVEEETGRILNTSVGLRVRHDRNLLGGFLVRVGDFALDGTVERQLDDIRRQLLA